MKIHLVAAIFFAVFGLSLSAQETESKVAAELKGKLVGIAEGEAVEVELKGAPEYYVFYFSASW